METLVKRLRTFIDRCRSRTVADVDDASPVYDMIQDLERATAVATTVRLFVFTNASTRTAGFTAESAAGADYTVHVWDLGRLHRLLTSGILHEPIVVDFVQRFGEPLVCLSTPKTDDDYSVLLAIIPGGVLANLYDEYGTRLLDLASEPQTAKDPAARERLISMWGFEARSVGRQPRWQCAGFRAGKAGPVRARLVAERETFGGLASRGTMDGRPPR